MHLQSQLKSQGNMLLAVDLNIMEALDPDLNGVDQLVDQTSGVDLKDSLAGINSNQEGQEDQDGTNSNLIKVDGLDSNSQGIGINLLNNNPGNNKVARQHLVQLGINHSSNNLGSSRNKLNGVVNLGVEHQLLNQLLPLQHKLNLLQLQTLPLASLIILLHGLLIINIVNSMAFKL